MLNNKKIIKNYKKDRNTNVNKHQSNIKMSMPKFGNLFFL